VSVMGNSRPPNKFSKAEQPYWANKEDVTENDATNDYLALVEECNFSPATARYFRTAIIRASGNELKHSNRSPIESMQEKYDFTLWFLFTGRIMLPREERERADFNNIGWGIAKMFSDNLSGCTRDEHGFNHFFMKYAEVVFKHELADIHDSRVVKEAQQVQAMQPGTRGFSLRDVPIIGKRIPGGNGNTGRQN